MKVYVAGPYTKGDVEMNVRNAMEAGLQLLDAGHEPFIPHLSHFVHMLSPRPYETWIRLDNAFLPHCNALVRLAGASRGADAEVALAAELGLPIYFSVADLLDFERHRQRTEMKFQRRDGSFDTMQIGSPSREPSA